MQVRRRLPTLQHHAIGVRREPSDKHSRGMFTEEGIDIRDQDVGLHRLHERLHVIGVITRPLEALLTLLWDAGVARQQEREAELSRPFKANLLGRVGTTFKAADARLRLFDENGCPRRCSWR